MKPFVLHSEDAFFVLVDVQDKLLRAISGAERVKRECMRLLEAARVMKLPVLVTEQYPKGLGPTDQDLTEKLPDVPRLPKTTFSCFGAEGFTDIVEKTNRHQAVIFGIESHICVYATAMEFLSRGYTTIVVADACGSRSEENHQLAVENLLAAGVAVLPLETVVYQLMARSGTAEFKAMLPLFK